MNKKIIIYAIIAFGLGVIANNYAMSNVPANYKVGIVDVKEVVKSSSLVKDLQQDQVKRADYLKSQVEKAQKEIDEEKDYNKKQALIKKHENNIKYIKTTNDKKYAEQLAKVDSAISATIQNEAKAKGYDLVIAKNVVLYGGTDITKEIAKVVK